MFASRLVSIVCAVVLLAAAPASFGVPPPTPKVPVADPLFGPHAVDPYRWLEDDSAPRVVAWAKAQTAFAIGALEAQPAYAPLRARVAALSRTSTSRFDLQIRGTTFFYERNTPPQAQPVLAERKGVDGEERVLFDPQAAAHGGPPDAIESVFPSPDGSYVAFTTQTGGSEDETLHVVDVATATLLPDTIEHVGGGVSSVALAWDRGGAGFTYTHLPSTGPLDERRFNNELFHHTLGNDPSVDPYVFGKGQSRVAEYILLASPDGSRLAALVEPGDLGDYAVYVRDGATGDFTQVATTDDHVRGATFLGNTLLLKTSKTHGTFDILGLKSGDTFATARTFLAAGDMPIEAMAAIAGSLYLTFSDGGESVVRRYDALGELVATLPLPPHISVATVAGDPLAGSAIVNYASYDTPGRWVAYDPQSGKIAPTGVETTAPGDYSKLVVTRVFVPSKDGLAKIPLTIVRLPNAKRDGSAPTILTAYGGYGVIEAPQFIGTGLAWLERGGVLAYAGVRGGGEYGEDWHLAAVHATKTKSADDFASCATYLETHGFGNAKHLGIVGGSDGGFLMGLAITRNPSLYRAVVGFVGIYDIPRWQLSPNGASNIPEFGDANNPSDFAYIRKQSPYQQVRDGVAYPAMLMLTGENDPRVSPMNSRKMTARLQAASSSHLPVLLVQTSGAGHGIGASFDQRITQTTQFLTFFASQLGA
jgi:prolyl oligopeptidase